MESIEQTLSNLTRSVGKADQFHQKPPNGKFSSRHLNLTVVRMYSRVRRRLSLHHTPYSLCSLREYFLVEASMRAMDRSV